MQPFLFYIFLIFYVVCAFLFSVNFFEAFPIPNFSIKLFEISTVMVIVLFCLALGRKILKIFKFEFSRNMEKNFIGFATGICLLIFVLFLLGISGLYYKIIVWLVLLIMGLLSYDELLNIFDFNNKDNFTKFQVFGSIVLSVPIILMFITSFAPPTYYDSLVYHLALPQIYINAKKLLFVDFNFYSHFPQNMELLYTMGLLIGDEILPNLISFSLGLFTVIGLYSFSLHFFNNRVGMISSIFFCTSTSTMLLVPSSYVEAGLAFFTLCSIYAIFIFLENRETKFLILAGIFSGITFGIKYTGIIVLLLLNFILVFNLMKNKYSYKKVYLIILFNSITFIVFLPWAIKNIINVGNPVFPFLYNLFGYKNVETSVAAPKIFNLATTINYFSMLKEYSSVKLWDIIVYPLRSAGGIDILGGFGWILLFLLFPSFLFLINSIKNNPIIINLLLFSIGHFLIWFITAPVLRFLFPLLPVLSILCAWLVFEIYQKKIFVLKFVLPLLCIIFIISNFFIYFLIQDTIKPFNVALGMETKENYLSNNLRYSPYPVLLFANEHLSDKDKILFLGEQRVFYCRKNFVAHNAFAPDLFTRELNETKDVEKFRTGLKSKGFTHIIYNEKEGERIKTYGILQFTEQGKKNWEIFKGKLNTTFSYNGVYLYKL